MEEEFVILTREKRKPGALKKIHSTVFAKSKREAVNNFLKTHFNVWVSAYGASEAEKIKKFVNAPES